MVTWGANPGDNKGFEDADDETDGMLHPSGSVARDGRHEG